MTGWGDPGNSGRRGAKSRWEQKDRKGLANHVGHVVRRGSLLTQAERQRLIDMLTVDPAAKEDATTAA